MFLKAIIVVLLSYLCVLLHEQTHKTHTYILTTTNGPIVDTQIVYTDDLKLRIYELENYVWNKDVNEGLTRPQFMSKRVTDIKKIE
jgi:hypothetical protein